MYRWVTGIATSWVVVFCSLCHSLLLVICLFIGGLWASHKFYSMPFLDIVPLCALVILHRRWRESIWFRSAVPVEFLPFHLDRYLLSFSGYTLPTRREAGCILLLEGYIHCTVSWYRCCHLSTGGSTIYCSLLEPFFTHLHLSILLIGLEVFSLEDSRCSLDIHSTDLHSWCWLWNRWSVVLSF